MYKMWFPLFRFMFSATKLDICYTLIYQVHIMGYVPYVGWAISSHATVMIRLYVVKKKQKERVITLWIFCKTLNNYGVFVSAVH